jgi:hypothetical protein
MACRSNACSDAVFDPWWQRKHVGEDLPMLMDRLGHSVGWTVSLTVRPVSGDEPRVTPGVAMTQANRMSALTMDLHGG